MTTTLMSLEYHRAMKILNKQKERDWELESACHYCRKTAEMKDLSLSIDAEANLKDILEKKYP